MMNVKLFEIRDEGTTIPALAIKTAGNYETNEAEAWLWEYAGYYDREYVLLVHLDRSLVQYDPFKWQGLGRTMREAHQYIERHFDELESGAVVDVEYILGYRETPKLSERLRGVAP